MSQGHDLRLYDVDCARAKALAEKNECLWFDTLHDVIVDVDLVMLCTPLKETPKTIQAVFPLMGNGSILCEIASLKTRTVPILRKSFESGVKPLSVHPMFGPEAGKIEGQTVAVIPVNDQDLEVHLASSIFPGIKIVVVDAQTHDRCMASILSLTYFMNMAFARTLSKESLGLIKDLAGPTFTVQLALAQSVVGESHELIESLINDNVFSGEILSRFIDESRYIRRLLRSKPWGMRRFCDDLVDSMMDEHEIVLSRRIRNEFFESLRK